MREKGYIGNANRPPAQGVRDAPITYLEYADGLSPSPDRHVCHVTSVARLVTN